MLSFVLPFFWWEKNTNTKYKYKYKIQIKNSLHCAWNERRGIWRWLELVFTLTKPEGMKSLIRRLLCNIITNLKGVLFKLQVLQVSKRIKWLSGILQILQDTLHSSAILESRGDLHELQFYRFQHQMTLPRSSSTSGCLGDLQKQHHERSLNHAMKVPRSSNT